MSPQDLSNEDLKNTRLDVDGRTATIMLDRPDLLNPLDDVTVAELHLCLDAVEADAAIEIVLLRGAGRAFSAGGDLKRAVETHQNRAWMKAMGDGLRAVLDRIERSDRLVIAVVEGWCVAGGIELILACDYVLATDEARFSDGHLNFSLLPGAGGTQRMPRLMGMLRAKDLLLTARTIGGREAREMGLVTASLPAAELEAGLRALLDSLLAKSFSSRAAIKTLVNRGMAMDREAALAFEADYVLDYETGHPDAHEGLVAFLEKRAPNFVRGE